MSTKSWDFLYNLNQHCILDIILTRQHCISKRGNTFFLYQYLLIDRLVINVEWRLAELKSSCADALHEHRARFAGFRLASLRWTTSKDFIFYIPNTSIQGKKHWLSHVSRGTTRIFCGSRRPQKLRRPCSVLLRLYREHRYKFSVFSYLRREKNRHSFQR